MKIPVVPIHVVTSKTLREMLDKAEAQGKAFSKRQIEVLLGRRAIKPIRMLSNKKKKQR